VKYELREDALNKSVASADLKDDLLAESWAKAWARDGAKSDRYTLRRADGGWTMSVFRTQAGQWYATPAAG
jgi:hypothetical protein